MCLTIIWALGVVGAKRSSPNFASLSKLVNFYPPPPLPEIIRKPMVFVKSESSMIHSRRSHHRCSVRKGVRNFTKFTGKHLCRSLFFNKVAGLSLSIPPENIRKPFCEFCEISKNPFFQNTSGGLLLNKYSGKYLSARRNWYCDIRSVFDIFSLSSIIISL